MDSMQIATTIGSNRFVITMNDLFFNPVVSSATEKHNHISFEFMYIIEGLCIITANDTTHNLTQGHYSLTGPGVYHEQRSTTPVKKIRFSFEHAYKQSGDGYFPSQEDSMISELVRGIGHLSAKDDGTILSFINDIRTELTAHRFGYYAKTQALFTHLLLHFIRSNAGDTAATYDAPKRQPSDTRSIAIEDFFEANYPKKIALSDLAQELYISNRQTVRILRERYNMSFKQKIIEKRIEASKTLLQNTDLPVKDIAEHIGYETANFSALFKQKTGCTPKEYRAQNHI
jgi:AraC family 4-hydroxyphenylacetate 3-monooxygenase operon regulatory protein